MDYEWDAEKSGKTRGERGFGFEIMEDFNWDFALLIDVQVVDHEEREMWVGPIETGLYAVVITKRNDNTRIISLRKAERTDITKWKREFYND